MTAQLQQPPPATADQVQLDLMVRQLLGLTAFPDDDLVAFLADPGAADKFELNTIDPVFRTSFYGETLSEIGMFPGLLGAPLSMQAETSTVLSLDGSDHTPASLVADYASQADVFFAATTSPATAGGDVLAMAIQIGADLTDPAVCGGMDLSFVFNANNPAGAPIWIPGAAFPGDYYQGGNTFPNFMLSDCQASSFLDQTNAGGIDFGLPTSATGLLTVDAGVTTGLFLFPMETVGSGTISSIFFEHPTGTAFEPDNTRYQAYPDIYAPGIAIADVMDTADCDFGLVAPTPPAPTPTAPTVSTSSTTTPTSEPGSGGGGGGAGGSGGGAGGSGGGDTGSGGGTDVDAGGGTVAGTETVVVEPGEPDKTDAGLVAGGVLATILGGLGLSLLRHGKEEDETTATAQGTAGGAGPGPGDAANVAGEQAGRNVSVGGQQVAAARAEAAQIDEAAVQAAINEVVAQRHAAEAAHQRALTEYNRLTAHEAEESIFGTGWDAVTGEGKKEDAARAAAAKKLAETTGALREAISRETAVRAIANGGDQAGALDDMESRARDQLRRAQGRLASVGEVIGLDRDDEARVRTLSAIEADAVAASLTIEAVTLARNWMDPTSVRLTAVLDGLATGLRGSWEARARANDLPEATRLAQRWWTDLERRLQIERYQVLAEYGIPVDGSGAVIEQGALRQRLAADRLTWLEGFLQNAGWRRDDIRFIKAAELRTHVAEHYRHLSVMSADANMTEYFLAVAQAIRKGQGDINTWFRETYLGISKDDTGSFLDAIKYRWTTGIGTGLRTRGFDTKGEDIGVVRARIDAMDREADAAVALLNRAAKVSPSELSREDFLALRELGYLHRPAGGDWAYRVPFVDRTAKRATQMKFAGAPWLDAISANSITITALSVAVPELAAARVGALATRFGISAEAAMGLRLAVDLGIGTAIDVGLKAWESPKGKFDLQKAALDSVLQSILGLGVKAGGDKLVVNGVERAFDATFDMATRRAIAGIGQEVFGIPAEALTQLGYQYVADGRAATLDDFFGALIGAAMNRAASTVTTAGSNRVESWINNHDNATIRNLLSANPELAHAAAVDRQLNDAANEAFGRVIGDRALDSDAGHHIFEALRLGELTWDQLQRVYTARGDAMLPAMEAVGLQRDDFVRRVVNRARVQATADINAHYDAELANARQLDDAADRQRRIDQLNADRATELAKIADTTIAPTLLAEFALKSNEMEGWTREQLVDYTRRQMGDDAPAHLDTMTDIEVRQAALDALEAEGFKALAKATGDVITPGSASPTSDVDRSWSSEWFRRAAKKQVLAEMMVGRIDGELGPTTARAFDVNEYVNTMIGIGRFITQRSTFADVMVTLMVPDGAGGAREVTMPHRDVVEANTMAGAMLHASPERRATFEANKLKGLTGDALARMNDLFAIAKRELLASQRDIDTYIERERARDGAPTNPNELELRARDNLYGDRMRAIDELMRAIDALAADHPDRPGLLSRWELMVNRALRDGIETYSDISTLDLIVSRMQAKKGLTPTNLMRDPDFALGEGKILAHLTEQQIRGMYNDQILMLMHHIDALYTGHESPQKVARSLAKYAERALLAMNLMGEFNPDAAGQLQQLLNWTGELMDNKSNPGKQLELLRKWGNGDESAGIRKFLAELDKLPFLEGTTKPDSTPLPDSAAARLKDRQWMRELRAEFEAGGAEALAERLASELGETERGIAELERELRYIEQREGFRPQDRDTAARLEVEIVQLRARMHHTSGHNDNVDLDRWWVHPDASKWAGDLELATGRIDAMRAWWREDGSPPDPELAARKAQIKLELSRLEARRARITSS